MEAFEGKWVRHEKENMDSFFKAVGIPKMKRSMMGKVPDSKVHLEFSKNGDKWTRTNKVGALMKMTQEFEIGKTSEFEFEFGKVEANFSFENNCLLVRIRILKPKQPGLQANDIVEQNIKIESGYLVLTQKLCRHDVTMRIVFKRK